MTETDQRGVGHQGGGRMIQDENYLCWYCLRPLERGLRCKCGRGWLLVDANAGLPPDADRFAELATDLYRVHAAGGPLHVVLDDHNLDGQIRPYYNGWTDADLDALYYQGWPIADLDPGAPAVTEGLGMSTRQLCDAIAELMNRWTVEQRKTTVDRWKSSRA